MCLGVFLSHVKVFMNEAEQLHNKNFETLLKPFVYSVYERIGCTIEASFRSTLCIYFTEQRRRECFQLGSNIYRFSDFPTWVG